MSEPQPPLRLRKLELRGYRPFRHLSATLDDLTVLVGANASGKSSLFDFLQFVSFAAENELPTQIDPRSVKPRGGPGMVIGSWREEGVEDELTLADLSDGPTL